MKRTILTIMLLLLAIPAFAKPPKVKTKEVAVSGSYVNPKDSPAIWQADGSVTFPVLGDTFLLGPAVQVASGSPDVYLAGLLAEWNLAGLGGPFVGAEGLYDLNNAVAAADDYTVSARAGFKFPIGSSGLLKVYASKGVVGFNRDDTLAINLGIGGRF